MYSLAFCLSFLSVYCLYAISDRVEIEKTGVMLLLQKNKMLSLLLSGSAFLFSTFIFVAKVSLGVGVFASLSLWMVLACLVVLFMPFKIIKWMHIVLTILVSFSTELIMTYF